MSTVTVEGPVILLGLDRSQDKETVFMQEAKGVMFEQEGGASGGHHMYPGDSLNVALGKGLSFVGQACLRKDADRLCEYRFCVDWRKCRHKRGCKRHLTERVLRDAAKSSTPLILISRCHKFERVAQRKLRWDVE